MGERERGTGFEAMEEKLIQRLESAVARLEGLSAGGLPGSGGDASCSGVDDSSIVAFDEVIQQHVGRLSSAAENIGGQVLEVTKIVQQAFAVQRELLIKVKQFQVSASLAFVLFGPE